MYAAMSRRSSGEYVPENDGMLFLPVLVMEMILSAV